MIFMLVKFRHSLRIRRANFDLLYSFLLKLYQDGYLTNYRNIEHGLQDLMMKFKVIYF
jgi:hypothetical protein